MNTLLKEESTDDEDLFRRCWLNPHMYRRYAKTHPAVGVSTTKEPPAGYRELKVHGYQIHIKGGVPNTQTATTMGAKKLKEVIRQAWVR